MIVRIVKMTFKPEFISKFIECEKGKHDTIKNFEGCTHLDVLNDKKNLQIFFTYSYWNSETELNNYRNSDFFRNMWGNVKKMFAEKPQAWTTRII